MKWSEDTNYEEVTYLRSLETLVPGSAIRLHPQLKTSGHISLFEKVIRSQQTGLLVVIICQSRVQISVRLADHIAIVHLAVKMEYTRLSKG